MKRPASSQLVPADNDSEDNDNEDNDNGNEDNDDDNGDEPSGGALSEASEDYDPGPGAFYPIVPGAPPQPPPPFSILHTLEPCQCIVALILRSTSYSFQAEVIGSCNSTLRVCSNVNVPSCRSPSSPASKPQLFVSDFPSFRECNV